MSRNEHGTGLIEVLVLGGLIVALVLHAGLAAARVQAAGEAATEVAQLAAEAAARHGADAFDVAQRLSPGSDIAVAESGTEITVTVVVAVPLIGPENSPASIDVAGRATARISPYRSGHG